MSRPDRILNAGDQPVIRGRLAGLIQFGERGARPAALLGSGYARVALALLLALVAFFALFTYFVNSYTGRMYEFRQQEIKRLVEVGLNMVQPLRDQQARGEITAEEARSRAVDLVRRMTYTYGLGSNYLFMSSYDGRMLVQPFEPEKEGTNQWDLVDSNGKYIIRSLVAAATGPDRSGYVDYEYPPPGSRTPQVKLAYVAGIPEWNAYIGTGMYLGDIAAQNAAYTRRSLLLAIGLGAAILAVLVFALRPVVRTQRTLLRLFGEIEQDPERLPEVPLDRLRPGSEGWRLLAGFKHMLARIDRSKHDLQQSEERLALVLQGSNDGFFDWDLGTGQVYFSPRWKSMLGYADDEISGRVETWQGLLHPDDAARTMAALEDYLQGTAAQYEVEQRLRHKDGTYRWVLARGTALRDPAGQVFRMAGTHTDITGRKHADAEIRRQNEYLAALHDTALAVVGRLDVMDLLHAIADRAKGLVESSDAAVDLAIPGTDELERKVSTGLLGGWVGKRMNRYDGLNGRVFATGQPASVADYGTWEARAPGWDEVALGPVLAVPLRAGSEVVGVLALGRLHGAPPFTPDETMLMARLAELASIAMDNARLHTSLQEANATLERRVAERTDELQRLLQVSQEVTSTLELGPLLNLILDQLKAVVDYTGASVMKLEGDALHVLAYHGPGPEAEMLHMRFPLDTAPISAEVVRRQEPVVVADVTRDPLDRELGARAGAEVRRAFDYVRAWMGVPLVIKGRIIGMLTLDHCTPNFYAAEQARLVLAFANQVAIAIENARLYEQAEQSAVAAERNRLARELHDAVTQTLFAASLIANVLPALWDRNQPEARRRLDELAKLTRSALAEMRTLLVELRPAALLEHPLGDLLKQLAEASSGRAGIPVNAEIDGQEPVPAEVQIALYRIAQEALNNIAKHACATEATVTLICSPDCVMLSVRDNGAGFDPASIPPDHLGVGIMRERAAAIGAALTIDSAPGNGTQVSAAWHPGLTFRSN